MCSSTATDVRVVESNIRIVEKLSVLSHLEGILAFNNTQRKNNGTAINIHLSESGTQLFIQWEALFIY